MAVKRYTISDIHVGGLVDKKFVLEDDYAALEGQLNLMSKSREAWKENATALEKERDALQAECERLRGELRELKDQIEDAAQERRFNDR